MSFMLGSRTHAEGERLNGCALSYSITPMGAMFDDVSPDSVNEGDGGIPRMSANRNLYTTLRDAAGNERGANVNVSNELLTNANTDYIGTSRPQNGTFDIGAYEYLISVGGGGSTGNLGKSSKGLMGGL